VTTRGNAEYPCAESWENLADIIGRQPEPRDEDGRIPNRGDWRVAEIGINEHGNLCISEACDDWFGIELTPEEAGKLIAWIGERTQA
jgi:hypothetical protein